MSPMSSLHECNTKLKFSMAFHESHCFLKPKVLNLCRQLLSFPTESCHIQWAFWQSFISSSTLLWFLSVKDLEVWSFPNSAYRGVSSTSRQSRVVSVEKTHFWWFQRGSSYLSSSLLTGLLWNGAGIAATDLVALGLGRHKRGSRRGTFCLATRKCASLDFIPSLISLARLMFPLFQIVHNYHIRIRLSHALSLDKADLVITSVSLCWIRLVRG